MSNSQRVDVPVGLLYAGMVVPHDIYDYTHEKLLLAQGNILSAKQIEVIQRLNLGKPTIYVTAETERVMRLQGVSADLVKSRDVLEDTTGYKEVKYETLTMLEKITNAGDAVVPQKELSSVSKELSRTVDNTEPAVIVDLVNALAPVDEYLQRHCVNVSLLNGLFGKWLELPKETVDMLVLVGLLHDCGKAALPYKILSAQRGLTLIEFEVIKTHTIFSDSLLTEFSEVVRKAARGHHEKINGRGYPDGLSGERIPYISRITAVSDIYDAMTARRSYKDPKNPFSILAMLNELKGTELDARLVEVFVSKMPLELIGKPVSLSDGTVGIVHAVDVCDIEHPTVKAGDRVIKTGSELYCMSMFFEESDKS